MFTDKLRNLLRASGGAVPHPPGEAQPGRMSGFLKKSGEKEILVTRTSRGLEQFFTHIRGESGLSILDLGGANQENVSFITNLGHRLYSEDVLRTIYDTFKGEDANDQANPGLIEHFLGETLNYDEEQFDGVLVWDTLEYMAPALLNATLERLQRIVKPGSYLLAFFHSDDKVSAVPYYTFRIQDFNSLLVAQRGARKPAQLFNNRSLERLFSRFESVKFFLTREALREVIIRR